MNRLKDRLRTMFGMDLRSLALGRILFSLIILFDLANRARSLVADYTDQGIMPRSATEKFYGHTFSFSFHLLNGTWQVEAVLFGIAGVLAIMMLVGYRTRFATIGSWLFLISLQTRNPLILQGGDVLLRITLFWALFLPWGAAYSIDSARQLSGEEKKEKRDWLHCSGGTIAYLFQIAFVYWFAVLFKSQGAEWIHDGTAVYYALSLQQFALPVGQFLLHFPHLLYVMTFGVLALETVGPFLLFFPFFTEKLRLAGVAFFVSLHIGFALCMRLGPFPWAGMTTVLILLPGLFWNSLGRWLARRKSTNLKIFYDNGCGFCKRTVGYLTTFLILPNAAVHAAEEDDSILADMVARNSWIVVDTNGVRHYEFDGVITVLRASPLLAWSAPLLSWKPFRAFGTKMYRYVATRRETTCFPLQEIAPRPKQRRWIQITKKVLVNGIPALLIIYVFLWNVMAYVPKKFSLSGNWQNVGAFLRLDQRWSMFAPYPMRDDGWYVFPGRLRDGTLVDVFRGSDGIDWSIPSNIGAMYDGERWRKYMMNIWLKQYGSFRAYYAQYLCRTWNATHPYDQQLESFNMVFMLKEILPNYAQSVPRPVTIWQQYCLQKPDGPLSINPDFLPQN